jgi:hypothetical protein
MVDAVDSKSSVERRVGSSPTLGTKLTKHLKGYSYIMFKAFKAMFSKQKTKPACLEYLVNSDSSQFILWNMERTQKLNTFHDHESNKIKRWAQLNGYHIEEKIKTIV